MVAENADNITIEMSSGIYISKDYANRYYLRTDGESVVTGSISMTDNRIIDLKPGMKQTDAANISQVRQIGEVYLWAGVDTPPKALETDGLSYSRVGDKSELYSVIGTLYGKGTGTMTFNVPKMDPPDPNYPTIRYVIQYKL
jgi:hypothetical protein